MQWRVLTRGVIGVGVAAVTVLVVPGPIAPGSPAPVLLGLHPIVAVATPATTAAPEVLGAAEARAAAVSVSAPPRPALVGGERPTTVRGLAFGPDPRQSLDLYLPAAPGPRPLVVYVHGGGWVAGDKANADDVANIAPLVAHGFAVASVNYRLATEARFPAQIDDVRAALGWLRSHAADLGLDADRVAAFGVSAGAHLAVLLGVLERRPGVRAVVDWAGPIDIATVGADLAARPDCAGAWSYPEDPASFWATLVGGPVSSQPVVAAAADPINHLAAADPATLPRFLLAHGDRDCTVPLRQSERFAAAMRAVGRADAVELRVVAGGHVRQFPRDSELVAAMAFLDAALA